MSQIDMQDRQAWEEYWCVHWWCRVHKIGEVRQIWDDHWSQHDESVESRWRIEFEDQPILVWEDNLAYSPNHTQPLDNVTSMRCSTRSLFPLRRTSTYPDVMENCLRRLELSIEVSPMYLLHWIDSMKGNEACIPWLRLDHKPQHHEHMLRRSWFAIVREQDVCSRPSTAEYSSDRIELHNERALLDSRHGSMRCQSMINGSDVSLVDPSYLVGNMETRDRRQSMTMNCVSAVWTWKENLHSICKRRRRERIEQHHSLASRMWSFSRTTSRVSPAPWIYSGWMARSRGRQTLLVAQWRSTEIVWEWLSSLVLSSRSFKVETMIGRFHLCRAPSTLLLINVYHRNPFSRLREAKECVKERHSQSLSTPLHSTQLNSIEDSRFSLSRRFGEKQSSEWTVSAPIDEIQTLGRDEEVMNHVEWERGAVYLSICLSENVFIEHPPFDFENDRGLYRFVKRKKRNRRILEERINILPAHETIERKFSLLCDKRCQRIASQFIIG